MAPSTASALNPIVIPAVQIPPHFSTLGSGLLHETHARESVSTLTALLLTSPDIFPNKAKPKPWWRGQCLLYGLDAPQSLAIQSLREKLENALRRGDLQIPEHLVELEHVENGKFRKLNAQVREATGVKKEGKGGGGVKKDKEDPLKRVLGAAKVAKKTSTGAGKTAALVAAAKPRAKKEPGLEPDTEPGVKAKAKPRAKAQALPTATAAAGGNIQIYLTALPPAPAPRARQTAKRGASSAPKRRAPKAELPSKTLAAAAKRAGGGPGSRGGRGSRGGARGGRAVQPTKHEASSPPPSATRGRTKQTARCSTRGGPRGTRGRGGWASGGISTATVKEEEEEVHDGYDGWNYDRGGGYSDDGYPYKSEYSGHSGYSGSEGGGIKGEYDDEDGYYGYGHNTAF
ncbi:hypothetical protein HOY82DRAFT_494903 [Tuber indicum]|nr:hypothetical protein HOY82DRAFT_494903 [Tuber indicum]